MRMPRPWRRRCRAQCAPRQPGQHDQRVQHIVPVDDARIARTIRWSVTHTESRPRLGVANRLDRVTQRRIEVAQGHEVAGARGGHPVVRKRDAVAAIFKPSADACEELTRAAPAWCDASGPSAPSSPAQAWTRMILSQSVACW